MMSFAEVAMGVSAWGAEEWLVLITGTLAALGTMVVTIIGALQNRGLKQQIKRHDTACRVRHEAIWEDEDETYGPARYREEDKEHEAVGAGR